MNVLSWQDVDSLHPAPLHKNSAMASLSAEPSWSFIFGNQVSYAVSGPVRMIHYFSGPTEVSVEPKVSATRESESHSTSGGVGIAYYSTPAEYDPTTPQEYWELSADLARKYKQKYPLTLSYEMSVQHDAATSDIDWKNAFKLKFDWRFRPRLTAFNKIGCIFNLSSGEPRWYLQPLTACGGTISIDQINLVVLQIHASYPIYRTDETVGISKPKKKGKKPWNNPPPAGKKSVTAWPRIPHCTAYVSYCRTLSSSIDLFFSYDFTALDPGEPDPVYSSHGIGIGLAWSL